MIELNMYLASVLSMPRHISESDIIYTFLQCLIRDELDLAKHRDGVLYYELCPLLSTAVALILVVFMVL